MSVWLPSSASTGPPFARRRADEPSTSAPAVLLARGTDGTLSAEVTVAPLPGAGPYRSLALARDLRRMEQAEADLRRERQFSDLLLASVTEGMVGLDVAGRVGFANAAALRLFGCRESDLLGNVFHDVVHHSYPDGTPFPATECRLHAESNSRLVTEETTLLRRDGSAFHAEVPGPRSRLTRRCAAASPPSGTSPSSTTWSS